MKILYDYKISLGLIFFIAVSLQLLINYLNPENIFFLCLISPVVFTILVIITRILGEQQNKKQLNYLVIFSILGTIIFSGGVYLISLIDYRN